MPTTGNVTKKFMLLKIRLFLNFNFFKYYKNYLYGFRPKSSRVIVRRSPIIHGKISYILIHTCLNDLTLLHSKVVFVLIFLISPLIMLFWTQLNAPFIFVSGALPQCLHVFSLELATIQASLFELFYSGATAAGGEDAEAGDGDWLPGSLPGPDGRPRKDHQTTGVQAEGGLPHGP